MSKNIFKGAVFIFILSVCLSACQKNDLSSDGSASRERAATLQNEIKTALHDTKDGWILMLKNLNKNVRTAMPVLMKFDTLSGTVKITSAFTKEAESQFLLSASTGLPLLSFSTQSFISQIYTGGNTEVTDFFFKVLSVTNDSITIQPFRKGNIYQSEGGALIKLYKATAERNKWVADFLNTSSLPNLFTHTSFYGRNLDIRLKPTFSTDSIKSGTYLDTWDPGSLNLIKAYQPATQTNPALNPIVIEYQKDYPINTDVMYANTIVGPGLIYWQPITALTPAEYFLTAPNAFINLLRTDYLIVKSIKGSTIEVYAMDENGKVCMTGTIGF
ncbi:DUF4302 domain-containing protein [Niabella beijingensis]|uniref:DUF4302 domain-containing protein n=1 Tax=Niabella beijingensis TaxID=2872700 RepID=UPI001CBCFA03|nr:DUF4302 domain-containing protein [Niabella beijingensis]MBZ4190290.1 DUF4302 domain-containing protein [Niabella beijingensis]